MHQSLKRKNENANAIIKRNVRIKRDFYSKNDPTNVKQVPKNLKLLKLISRKRK